MRRALASHSPTRPEVVSKRTLPTRKKVARSLAVRCDLVSFMLASVGSNRSSRPLCKSEHEMMSRRVKRVADHPWDFLRQSLSPASEGYLAATNDQSSSVDPSDSSVEDSGIRLIPQPLGSPIPNGRVRSGPLHGGQLRQAAGASAAVGLKRVRARSDVPCLQASSRRCRKTSGLDPRWRSFRLSKRSS